MKTSMLRVLVVLAGIITIAGDLALSREVPLQSPIFRTRRLDFLIRDPLSLSPYYSRFLPIQWAQAKDVDGDGRQEIVVFNDPCAYTGSPGAFIIHLNAGGIVSATTASPMSAACNERDRPRGESFAAGDFDKDGRMDFVSWGSSTLFLQKSPGSFVERTFVLPLDPTEGYRGSTFIVSGDLNGDGIPDAVVTQSFDVVDWNTFYFRDATDIYVFLADGNGGFYRSQKVAALPAPGLDFNLLPVALKDFTGDGIPDYLVSGSGPRGAWEILPGDGLGHLSTPQDGISVSSLPTPLYYSNPSVVATGDLNADGLTDLVLTGTGPLSVALSTGVGQFAHPQALPDPPSDYPYFYYTYTLVQDVDGDGRQDIQLLGDGSIVTYPGGGDGTFGTPQKLLLPLRPQGSVRMRWDEDSLPDVVYYGYPSDPYYTGSSDNLSVFLSPSALNRDQIDITPPWEGAYPRAVGDFDGDGEKDLLFAGGGGTNPARVVVYRGNGHGGFQPLPDATSPSGGSIRDAIAADFNRDGRDDVVILTGPTTASGQGSVTAYLGQAPGDAPALLFTKATGHSPVKAAVADLNGDGNSDLVVADAGIWIGKSPYTFLMGGTVSAYLGQQDGTVGRPAVVVDSSPPGYYPGIIDLQTAQVNGDGVPDLLILFSDRELGGFGSIGTWADGLGDGLFAEPYYYNINYVSSILFPLVTPADVNGDGRTDLALSAALLRESYPGNHAIGTFLGHREEVFSQFGIGSDGCTNPGRFVDLNGDGFLDVAGSDTDFDALSFCAGSGTGDFSQQGPTYAPGSYLINPFYQNGNVIPPPLYGDFNDDDREDVVVWDIYGKVFLLLNRSNRVASDPAESQGDSASGTPRADPEIDLAEIQARVGAYDFLGKGVAQGALVFTLSLHASGEDSEETAGPERLIVKDRRPPGMTGIRLDPGSGGPAGRSKPAVEPRSFQLFLNFGEALKDSDGDGRLDLSLANAIREPGLSGIPLADAKLTARADDAGPAFTGLHNLDRYSWVDWKRGIITFVVPFEDLRAAMTPAERDAMDQGDGTGRIFLWAQSRLFGDRDRVPDTDDGGDPTVNSEVREFRFPLGDLRATPSLTFGDVLITTALDGPLTFANHGVAPVSVSEADLPDAALSLSTPAPFTVPPAGRVQQALRFAPSEHARITGDARFQIDDPAKTTVQMTPSGRGVAPILELTSPSTLDFGSTPEGLVSRAQYVQVRNVGDAPLYGNWNLLDPEGQFSWWYQFYVPPFDRRDFVLYPDQSWNSTWYFLPNRTGPAEATFRLTTDDPFHPGADTKFQGMGTPPEPRISLYFGYETIRDAPMGGEASQIFGVGNQGSAPLHILSITSSNPDFRGSMDSTTIAPGSWGFLTLTYRPTAWGLFSSTITVTSDDPTRPTISGIVYGQAFEPPPQGHVSRTVLDFGTLHQGESSTSSFDLSNTGSGPLRIQGPYPLIDSWCSARIDPTIPEMVLPGETLTVHVTFSADIDKTFCNQFYFYTNDQTLGAVYINFQFLVLSPTITNPFSVNFPLTAVGSSSILDIEIGNTGQDVLRITGATSWHPEFNVSTSLPFVVLPGETGTLQVVFTPTVGWTTYSALDLSTNDLSNRRVTIYLSGAGW